MAYLYDLVHLLNMSLIRFRHLFSTAHHLAVAVVGAPITVGTKV